MVTLEDLLNVPCFVTFKAMENCVGKVQFSNGHIWIDLTGNDNIAKTFIHELLHLYKPRWSEKKVLRWENRIWEELTHDEVELVYRKLYRDSAKRSA